MRTGRNTRERRLAMLAGLVLGVVAVAWALVAEPSWAVDTRLVRFKGSEEMAFVPGGPFRMGAAQPNGNRLPMRRVDIGPFYIDRFEVTRRDYAACVDAGVCAPPKAFPNETSPNQPIVGVRWTDAWAYCGWVGKRLPTEAEWEKAARGTDGRTYPWGEGLNCGDANFGNGHGRICPNAPGHTAPVGAFPRDVSPYGVYDMAGNVWEFVADPYRSPNASTMRAGDYAWSGRSPNPNVNHVVKGGAWYTTPPNMPAHSRISRPNYANSYDGFRCARGR